MPPSRPQMTQRWRYPTFFIRDRFMTGIASRIPFQRVGILAALVVPLLSACGGGGSSAPVPPPAPATALSLLAGNTDGAGNQDGTAPSTARLSAYLVS